MNRYRQMYLEQNSPKGVMHEMQEELSDLFDMVHPYQHWTDAHVTTGSVRRHFRLKYDNDISNYTK